MRTPTGQAQCYQTMQTEIQPEQDASVEKYARTCMA